MESTVNITLESIIQRKILYCQNSTSEELFDMNTGYIRGFQQMLADMNLSETEFITKYLDIIKSLKTVFDSSFEKENPEENIDVLSGYNNAIIDVLSLLDEKYLYDAD